MTFAGPALAALAYLAEAFKMQAQVGAPISPENAYALAATGMDRINSAIEFGMLSCAIGVLITTAVLVYHFWPDTTAPHSRLAPLPSAPAAPKPAPRPAQNDDRYKPKYSYAPNL